jgi:hypothetical protein
MSISVIVDKIAFESEAPYRGFTIRASYLKESPDALIEIFRHGTPYGSYLYPAYRIWNLIAHFPEFVDEEMDRDLMETKF